MPVRYQFIEEHRIQWPVAVLCKTLAVARSGFYDWQRRPKSRRTQEDEALSDSIKVIHQG